MEAKFICESVEEILKPKTEEEIKRIIDRVSEYPQTLFNSLYQLDDKMFNYALNRFKEIEDIFLFNNITKFDDEKKLLSLIKKIRKNDKTVDLIFGYCARKGFFSIIKYLIDFVDVNYENDYALRWSAYYGHYEIVKLLLKHGANVSSITEKDLQKIKNKHIEIYNLIA